MSSDIKTEISIPDIWYDFFARFLPGVILVFSIWFFLILPIPNDISEFRNNIASINGVEFLLLAILGYFVGLFLQPLSTGLIKKLSHICDKDFDEKIYAAQKTIGQEARRAKILSKMGAEAMFFSQLAIFILIFLFVSIITHDFSWCEMVIAIIISAYSTYGCFNFLDRRLKKALGYSKSSRK